MDDTTNSCSRQLRNCLSEEPLILQNVYRSEDEEKEGAFKVLTPRKIKEKYAQIPMEIGKEKDKRSYIIFKGNGNYQELYTFSTWFSTRGKALEIKKKNKIYILWKTL